MRWTSAARWIRLEELPPAMDESVPMEHGQIIMPSVRLEPLATGLE